MKTLGNWREAQRELPQGFVPFGLDVGMEALCLFLEPEDYGAVYRSDGFVEYLGRPAEMHRLADSFPAFLDMLFDRNASKPVDVIEQIAKSGGREDVLKYLAAGGSLDDKSEWGGNLAVNAAAQGNLEVLKTCIELGSDLGDALTVAIYNHEWDVMRFLVATGADVNKANPRSGETPLQAIYDVSDEHRAEIENFLKAHGAK